MAKALSKSQIAAEIAGKALELSGYLFAKDFPEIVRQIGSGAAQARTGSIFLLWISEIPRRRQ